jgi:hypothetical protein
MARRYDSRTTIFSPEGRLYQVEYAMEAISNAGAAIGMLCKDGVVLVAEKKITSKLLDTHAVGVRREKMYKLDDHVCCAVAGITGATLGPTASAAFWGAHRAAWGHSSCWLPAVSMSAPKATVHCLHLETTRQVACMLQYSCSFWHSAQWDLLCSLLHQVANCHMRRQRSRAS